MPGYFFLYRFIKLIVQHKLGTKALLVAACNDTHTGWCTYRRCYISLCKTYALYTQRIYIGCMHMIIAVTGKVAVPKVIGDDEDDVGRGFGLS